MLITQEEIEGGGEIERFQWTKDRYISKNLFRGAYNTLVHLRLRGIARIQRCFVNGSNFLLRALRDVPHSSIIMNLFYNANLNHMKGTRAFSDQLTVTNTTLPIVYTSNMSLPGNTKMLVKSQQEYWQYANVFSGCFFVYTHQFEYANFNLPCEGRSTLCLGQDFLHDCLIFLFILLQAILSVNNIFYNAVFL